MRSVFSKRRAKDSWVVLAMRDAVESMTAKKKSRIPPMAVCRGSPWVRSLKITGARTGMPLARST